jgi:hypothetical protein
MGAMMFRPAAHGRDFTPAIGDRMICLNVEQSHRRRRCSERLEPGRGR